MCSVPVPPEVRPGPPGGGRSVRMTLGFVLVVGLVSSMFLVLDVLLAVSGLSLAWQSLTAPAQLPLGFRLESIGVGLLPLLALVWLVGGTWLAASRFRRGAVTRRWLVPVAVPWFAHVVFGVVANLRG